MPDLQDQLRSLADRRADETTGDFDAVVATARSRRHRRTAGWSAALAVAVVAVVGSQVVSRPETQPAAPVPTAVGLVIAPSTVRAGEHFTATVPAGVRVGLLFGMTPVVESPDGFALRAQAPGVTTRPASWQTTVGRPGTGLVIPAYVGPGPFDLVAPDEAAPGEYRVCNAGLCGLLTVVR